MIDIISPRYISCKLYRQFFLQFLLALQNQYKTKTTKITNPKKQRKQRNELEINRRVTAVTLINVWITKPLE